MRHVSATSKITIIRCRNHVQSLGKQTALVHEGDFLFNADWVLKRVLQLAVPGLIKYRIEDSEARRMSPAQAGRIGESFFQLDRRQRKERGMLRLVLEAFSAAVGDAIPDSAAVETVTFMMRYRDQETGR